MQMIADDVALLAEAALAHPRMAQADSISLDVWEHNLRAQRFYRRFARLPGAGKAMGGAE